MSEELCSVPYFVNIQAVDCLILLSEYDPELLLVNICHFTEALPKEPEEPGVYSLLHAALDDHSAEFLELIFSNGKLEQLMTALIEINGAHDDQVDRSSKVDHLLFWVNFDLSLSLSDIEGLTWLISFVCLLTLLLPGLGLLA